MTPTATGYRSLLLPGYVCMVAKRHVVEPFELPEAERHQFWEEAMMAARRLNSLLAPSKMNYEIHGNTMPHLNMHLSCCSANPRCWSWMAAPR